MIDILAGLAAAAAAWRIAVLQARVRRLAEEAITDPLTGAFNRRQMYAALDAAVERKHRLLEPASILLIDVDRFKAVNDRFGHAAGDHALTTIVRVIEGRFRKLDVLFRAGGEEFVLLLAGTPHAAACAVAEELRALVLEARPLPDWPLSNSLGVAVAAPHQSVQAWLADADAALYLAKRRGRNRVAGDGAEARKSPAQVLLHS
jgi:diguanylate cyclase (GGDEF)-like protein